MNEIFNFHGHEVRTMTINDEPWFVGKDVADILGYSKARNAIALHRSQALNKRNYLHFVRFK